MQGEEAEKWERFVESRRPEQMQKWAEDAELPEFQILGKGALSADDPRVGQGVWLLFEKKPEVVTEKEEDQVEVEVKGDARVYSVTSPSGIGGAIISPWQGWPKKVIIRLHLRGLESFGISNGKIKLSASVLSHSGNPRLLYLRKCGEEKKVEVGSPYWTEIKVLDADGRPVQGLPSKGGYFEVTVPKTLIENNPKSLTLGWIDFYRQ